MKFVAFFTLVLAAASVQAQQARAPVATMEGVAGHAVSDVGPQAAVAQLRKLAEDYNAAMVRKDAGALLAFYYDDHVSVIGSVAPTSYARMVAASKGKAPKVFPANAKDQSANDASTNATAEKMSHVHVETDGTVASLQYDYSIPQGYGRTFWTLIRTKDSWKITAIVYSINMVPMKNG